MINIENLTVKYNNVAVLDDLSFTIDSSEMVCIKGESGTGKTTLLKAILGFTPIDSGKITINDLDLNEKNIDQIRKEIAWIPQELSLPCEWVSEMVNLPFSLKANKHISFDKKNLLNQFYKLGLDVELYEKRVTEISGGQRQRIMIAVSRMLDKDILILDEPTSALDSKSCEKVIEYLKDFKQNGKTIMIVSHDMQLALACDRIITLNNK